MSVGFFATECGGANEGGTSHVVERRALPLIRQQVERRIGVLRAPPRPERPVPRKLLSRRIGPSLVCAVGRWRERVRDVGLCATHQGLLRVLERR